MKCSKGDLVKFESRYGDQKSGIVLDKGMKVSLYVEDRPYRIIDATSYSVMYDGTKGIVYDHQIEKIFNCKEISNV